SINGPFFNDRDISNSFSVSHSLFALGLGALANNHVIRTFVASGLITKCWLTPGGLGTGHTNTSAPFTTAMRMVSRGHRGTAYFWTATHMALATGFTKLDIAVFNITNLTNRGTAFLQNQANFAAWHADMGIFAFFCQQLGRSAGRANHLGALTRLQFDGMNVGTNRNIRQGKVVTGSDFCTGTRHQGIAYFDADRGDNVALLAISIEKQSQ